MISFAKGVSPIQLVTGLGVFTVLILRGDASPAQTGDGVWQEQIRVTVRSAEPVEGTNALLVRLPSVTEPTLSNAKMPKPLAAETGSFSAYATARAVIGADGSVTDCRTEKANISHDNGRTLLPEVALALDVCPLVAGSAHFRHAVDVDGRPLASAARLSVSFHRSNRPPIVIPWPDPPATSGHVLSESGQWTDTFWANSDLMFGLPDWSAALPDRRDLPMMARVGVKLRLTARMGIGWIDSCRVVLSSKDARLDAATCKALTSTTYAQAHGSTSFRTIGVSYPVLVRWHAEGVDMTAPARPTVPHMPRDVPLAVADEPVGEPPALRAIPIQIELDEDGRATGCKVVQSSGDDGWDAAGCRIALRRASFTAAKDEFGRPAKGLYEAVADWSKMTIRPLRE